MNWLSCLKWDPCEMQERRAKGVFRTKHPHRRQAYPPFKISAPPRFHWVASNCIAPQLCSKVSVRLSPAKNPTTVPHSGQKKIKEIGQTFCCNLKSACVKAIWDLFPHNDRQVTKIHFQDMTRFKMVYYMSWLLPYLKSKTIFSLSNSFVFYWFLKCSMSHTSFSSLATCRSFCDNRSHMLLFKS